jgi:hypothetical protein
MDRNPFMGATQAETLAFLNRNFPSETPLAGGAAKVKELDRELLDRYIPKSGRAWRSVKDLISSKPIGLQPKRRSITYHPA